MLTIFHKPLSFKSNLCLCLVANSCTPLATPWTVAHQAALSMEFSRQEYWSGFPCPSPEDLPNPGIKPRSPVLQVMLYHMRNQGSPSHQEALKSFYLINLTKVIKPRKWVSFFIIEENCKVNTVKPEQCYQVFIIQYCLPEV